MFARDLKQNINLTGHLHRTRYPLTLASRVKYTMWDVTYLLHRSPFMWTVVASLAATHLAFTAVDRTLSGEAWCMAQAVTVTLIVPFLLSLGRQITDVYRLYVERARELSSHQEGAFSPLLRA